MEFRRPAVGVAGLGAIVVILLVVTGAGAFYVGQSTSAGSTITKTVSGGGAASTVISTSTLISTVSASLVDKSKAEMAASGAALTIYGVVDASDFAKYFQPGLKAAFPWMTINYVGLGASDLVTRATAEKAAGKVQADILQAALGTLSAAIQTNLCAKITNDPVIPFYGLPSSAYDANGYWWPANSLMISLVYNTNTVKPTDVPKAWTDLANPKWNNLIAIQNPASLGGTGTMFAQLSENMSSSDWLTLMKGIAANHPNIQSSNGAAYSLVSTGQAALAIGLSNDYLNGVTQKLPVGWDWLQPAMYLPSPQCMTAGSPHPASAQLYIEWLASPAGQAGVAASGRLPLDPRLASYYFPTLYSSIPSGQTIAPGPIHTDFFTNSSKWAALYKSIFG